MAEDHAHDRVAPAGSEEPWQEPGTIPLRPVVIIGGILLLGALGYLGYSCAHSPGTGGSFTAPVTQYPPGSVTYIAPGRTYLVRHDDGSFVALSEIEANGSDRLAGCVIRYRADLSAAGQTRLFRDDCHGTLFNLEGVAVEGSAPPMQQHPVTSSKDAVAVRLTECLAGGGSESSEPCRE